MKSGLTRWNTKCALFFFADAAFVAHLNHSAPMVTASAPRLPGSHRRRSTGRTSFVGIAKQCFIAFSLSEQFFDVHLSPNVKDEPRLRLARLLRKQET